MSSLPGGNRAAYFSHHLRNLLPVRQLRMSLARRTTSGERGRNTTAGPNLKGPERSGIQPTV
jgi:hypothetical protein